MPLGDAVVLSLRRFKVHMRPKALEEAQKEYTVSPLPFGKSVEDVFGDFLAYIYGCIEDYFKTSRAHGESMWESFDDRVTFVLTHPNGYEVREQALMRKAAVKGGLVPSEEAAKTRVQLVTEGEASLHYCLDSGLADEALKVRINQHRFIAQLTWDRMEMLS